MSDCGSSGRLAAFWLNRASKIDGQAPAWFMQLFFFWPYVSLWPHLSRAGVLDLLRDSWRRRWQTFSSQKDRVNAHRTILAPALTACLPSANAERFPSFWKPSTRASFREESGWQARTSLSRKEPYQKQAYNNLDAQGPGTSIQWSGRPLSKALLRSWRRQPPAQGQRSCQTEFPSGPWVEPEALINDRQRMGIDRSARGESAEFRYAYCE